ncbi:hypothetical protein [Izhakiella australiensis]|uniref:hypothetical protein n=1 Tax=Izhakiella australiensis TaxID=1926881 RepID=UPI00111560B1|nr:hypothetical protein [Izhakiella australiensis]
MGKYVISDDVFYREGLRACGFSHYSERGALVRHGDVFIVKLACTELLKKNFMLCWKIAVAMFWCLPSYQAEFMSR